jgi:hypothetical protein
LSQVAARSAIALGSKGQAFGGLQPEVNLSQCVYLIAGRNAATRGWSAS